MKNILLANKKVLVVEDDDACRYYLEIVLEKLGCVFAVAVNGQEAVRKLRAGKFDIVFMDLRMPVMNGYEATSVIRDTCKDLPVIALTAQAMAWDEGKCQECGMNDRLIKPFKEEHLVAMMLKWTAGTS